jgi:hypothetical protein
MVGNQCELRNLIRKFGMLTTGIFSPHSPRLVNLPDHLLGQFGKFLEQVGHSGKRCEVETIFLSFG